MPRHHKLSEVAIFSGGVAMLVLIAVVFSGFNLRGFGLGAAAITASQTFGASTLTLSAADSPVALGGSTMLSWDATSITDQPNKTFCLTDGTACNTPVQSFGTTIEGQSVQYAIGGVQYLTFYPRAQGTSNSVTYKWSGSCWGDGSGVCGGVYQTLPEPYASASYFIAPDGNSYLAFAANNNARTSNIIYKWSTANSCWGDGYTCEDASTGSPVYYFQRPPVFSPNAYGVSTATIGSNFYLFLAQNGGTDFSRLFQWMAKPTLQQATLPVSFGLNGYTVIEKSWPLDPGRTVSSIGVYIQTAGATNVKVKIVKWNPSAATYDVVVDKLCPISVAGWNDCTLNSPYTVPTSGVYYAAAYNGSYNGGNASYTIAARAYRVGDIVGNGQGSFNEQSGTGEAIRATYQSGGAYNCFGTGGSCNAAYQNFPAPQAGGYYAAGGGQLFTIGATTYLLAGDYSNSAPHLFKWMSTTVVPGWYTNPPNTGYAGNSVVDRDYVLVPGSTVTRIGFYSSGAQTAPKIKIFRRNGYRSYDVVYDQAVSHTGGGWLDFTLNTPFAVPTTGEYYAGVYVSNAAGYSASGGTQANIGGDQALNSSNNGYNEAQGGTGVITRTTYSSAVSCFGDGSTCGNPLQTFPNASPLNQSLTNDTGGWKIFTSGSDTFAAEATGENSYLFKWNAASNCFGSISGACGTPFQEVPRTGSGANWGDGWNIFTYAGKTFGMLQQYGGNSYLFRWMNVSMQQGGTPTGTALGGNTSLHRLLQLVNGATVSKIGVYSSTAASMKIKILKRNSAGNYDIVVDQAFSHPGTGWYDVALNTPYSVPASGDYYPAVYSTINIGSFANPSGVTGYYSARSYKGTDALGTGQTFSEDNGGNNAPALRVTYTTNAVWCMGDGLSICNDPYVNLVYGFAAPALPAGTVNGLNYISVNSVPYIAVSSATGNSGTYKFASLPCFGNATNCASSASIYLQSFAANQATNDWESFTTNSGLYLLEANALSGGSSKVYKWMSASQCLGDGTTCGSAVQSLAQNFSYMKDGTASDGTIYVAAGGVPTISGGTYSASTYIYKWMSGSNCLGDGTTCGTALQTFPWNVTNMLLYTIGANTYLGLLHGPGNSQSQTYKLNPAGNSGKGCFGDAGGTCGNVYQTVSGDAYEWNTTTIGSNTYLLDINRKNRSYIYKWTASGSGCPAGGGWGDGTSCDTGSVGAGDCSQNSSVNFQLIGGYGGSTCDTHHTTGIFFTQGGNTYLSIGTDGGSNEFWGTSIWMPSANGGLGCFGDGVATCNALYDNDVRDNAVGKENIFTSNGNTYLTVPLISANNTHVYKWSFGTGCPSNGGWGNGSACGSTSYFQTLPITANNEFFPFTSGFIYGLGAGNSPFLYQFIDNPSPDIGCSVTWQNASGSGVFAAGDTNPGVSTGPLFSDTTYTLMCPGVGSVSIVVPINGTPGTVSISANPATFNVGSTTAISWTASNNYLANTCGVSQTDPNSVISKFSAIGAGDNTSLNTTPSTPGAYSYKLTCMTLTTGGNNGTLVASPSSVAGKLAEGLSFNGSSQYVSAPSTSALNFGSGQSFSASFWFKTTQNASSLSWPGFIYKEDGGVNPTRVGWGCNLNKSNLLSCETFVGGTQNAVNTSTVVNDGLWHHATFVRNTSAGTLTLYVDGTQVAQQTGINTGSLSNTIPLYIGVRPTNGPAASQYLSGSLDDVRIYSRALSSDEASTLYNLGPISSGLVGYWPLDAATISGTTAYEESGGLLTADTTATANVVAPPTLSGCTTALDQPPGCNLYLSTSRVRQGDNALLSWNVTGLSAGMTCSFSSAPSVGGLPAPWSGGGTTYSGSNVSIGPITTATNVTLSCTGSGVTTSVQKMISLVPAFQER